MSGLENNPHTVPWSQTFYCNIVFVILIVSYLLFYYQHAKTNSTTVGTGTSHTLSVL